MSPHTPSISRSHRRTRSRLTVFAATALVVAGALSACSNAPAAIEAATADRLQASVLDVTSAAATGDYDTALSLLSAVEADLRTAASAGQVTPERSSTIQSAISAVNSDLLAAIDARVPEPTPTSSNSNSSTLTPTATPTPTSDDNKNEDEDKNGNGKGTDKECKSNDDVDADGMCNKNAN